MKRFDLGIIGGGQLGRMLALAAYNLGISVSIYCQSEEDPGFQVVSKAFLGQLDDKAKLIEFAKTCRVVTFEFENLDASILREVEFLDIALSPNSGSLAVSQDRLVEKEFFYSLPGVGEHCARHFFEGVGSVSDVAGILSKRQGSYFLKTRRGGYDGLGQKEVSREEDLSDIELRASSHILEGKVDFAYEISIISVRDARGNMHFFPIPVNEHKGGILRRSIIEGEIDKQIERKAKKCAELVGDALGYIGVFTLEFFVLLSGDLIFNEMAPRVHNSGHFTQDLCNYSQFEAHVRAVMGYPVNDIAHLHAGQMVNLIGDDIVDLPTFLSNSSARPYIYGKTQVRDGRKMGHVNLLLSPELHFKTSVM